jgi:nitroreductase
MSESLFHKRLELDPLADDFFIERWSPRAFEAHEVKDQTVQKIVDAARWAPSCFNEQPWRFAISTQDTFDAFLSLLVEANRGWCQHASRLGFIAAKKNFSQNGKANQHAWFDCGAAWVSMAFQAQSLGLHMHAMAGIQKDKIISHFNMDTDQYDVVCGFALGKRSSDLSTLSEDMREKEVPNTRKKRDEIASMGEFPF